VLHSLRQHWEEVDSRLLVVGSQTDSLTPGPSFAHNLGCRCPNGQCKAILAFKLQDLSIDIKNAPRQGDLTPQIIFWVFENPGGLHFPTFGSVSCILTLSPKVGLRQPCHGKPKSWIQVDYLIICWVRYMQMIDVIQKTGPHKVECLISIHFCLPTFPHWA
jgi:hypothetical protein